MNEVNTHPTTYPDTATPTAAAPATDLLDSDLSAVRAHLSDAFATRGLFAMWRCCQDEAGLLGDVDRLATEVGRLRHDFAVISDDLDDATAELARVRHRAALADADHAQLIAHVRAALATGELGTLRTEMDHRGLSPTVGRTPAAVLAEPALEWRSA